MDTARFLFISSSLLREPKICLSIFKKSLKCRSHEKSVFTKFWNAITGDWLNLSLICHSISNFILFIRHLGPFIDMDVLSILPANRPYQRENITSSAINWLRLFLKQKWKLTKLHVLFIKNQTKDLPLKAPYL